MRFFEECIVDFLSRVAKKENSLELLKRHVFTFVCFSVALGIYLPKLKGVCRIYLNEDFAIIADLL